MKKIIDNILVFKFDTTINTYTKIDKTIAIERKVYFPCYVQHKQRKEVNNRLVVFNFTMFSYVLTMSSKCLL